MMLRANQKEMFLNKTIPCILCFLSGRALTMDSYRYSKEIKSKASRKNPNK